MMLSLAMVTLVAEILSLRQFSISQLGETSGNHSNSPVFKALSKIEMPLFIFPRDLNDSSRIRITRFNI